MAKKINYDARNFADVRAELISYIKQYYPALFSDFNDSSVGMMLLELNAAVGDMLSYNTDRKFNETQIDFAQERRSLMNLARTFGLKVPNKAPSVTIADFSVTVPASGDKPDPQYLPVVRQGARVSGGGQNFEAMEDIDFSSALSSDGIDNRLVVPNFDANGNILNYTITKREVVVNGTTKIFQRIITDSDAIPFFQVTLPETNVISIEQLITLNGTNYNTTPTLDQFLNSDNRFYEVEALAQNKIFEVDYTRTSDRSGVSPGKWVEKPQRFIKEFTDLNFCKMTFGSGFADNAVTSGYMSSALANSLGDFLNNTSLGEIPQASTTMFVRYRVGGGTSSNVGSNTITSVSQIDMYVNGPNDSINQAVRSSIAVNNPVPAFGGNDAPSVDEIRNLVRYNFSSQERAVTVKDYKARIDLMPGKYGRPFRSAVWEEQNKVQTTILTLDSDGKLSNTSTSTIKENIADYLSDYRLVNDYILINDGKIINLAFELDLFIDKQFSQSEVAGEVISKVQEYMDVESHDMGGNIYLGQLLEAVNNINGVINVLDIRVFNKVGGDYSDNQTSQPYSDASTKQIDLLGEYTLFAEPDMMFEIKYPTVDVTIKVKK